MATSNTTRSRKRCPHNQGQLWLDQTKDRSSLKTPSAQELAELAETRDAERPWVLDDTTKARGRRGLAQVRRILAHTEPEQLDLFGRRAPSSN